MSSIKRVLITVLAALALPSVANAWTFSLSGSARCDQQTGQYTVSFVIDNSTEPEPLTVTASNRASVAAGSTVAARSTRTVDETLPGTTSGGFTLTVSGNWPSDQNGRTRSSTVVLAGSCSAPPSPPPVQSSPPVQMSDDCPNLDGIQGSVPEGMIKDSAGACVPRPLPPPPPVDECPNLDGEQAQVPTGMTKDGAGNCNAPPPPATSSTQSVPPAQSSQAPVVQSGVAGVTKTKSGRKTGKAKRKGGVKGAQAGKKKKKKAGGALPRTK